VIFELSAMVSRLCTSTGKGQMYIIIIESVIFTVAHCETVPENYGFSNLGNHAFLRKLVIQ
jgi:hypothetical protein